jgi:hypothetical protein
MREIQKVLNPMSLVGPDNEDGRQARPQRQMMPWMNNN